PDRKVLCIHGDGGAMYTVQALWTMAREKLDVVNVIFSNRSYAILSLELMRADTGNAGPKALSMFDLSNPEITWPKLAESMGVNASRAETVDEFNRQLADALRTKGPHLIEAVV
ncbi:MAG: thiamine pyrophosphate-dependent enzyme, partial [Alphaproteobacteria bacterium]